jgi:uncharacterized phiE125 gp8 family phage protein
MNAMKVPIINLVTDAEAGPLELAEVKNFLRVDESIDDNLIAKLIKTATKQCELYTGKTLITKTYRCSFYNSIEYSVNLLYSPIQSIVSIKTVDAKNNETLIDDASYFADMAGGILNFNAVPANFYRIDITYIAGFGNVANEVPEDLKQAMLIHIARMYDDKSGYSLLPTSCLEIYKKYKLMRL